MAETKAPSRVVCSDLLGLNNVCLSLKLSSQRIRKMERCFDALTRMTGGEQMIISISIPDHNLVNDLLDLGAVLANDANKNNSVPDELLHQTIQPGCVSLPLLRTRNCSGTCCVTSRVAPGLAWPASVGVSVSRIRMRDLLRSPPEFSNRPPSTSPSRQHLI